MKKQLEVSALENGTVIDHIPSDALYKVMRVLSLENITNMITFGTNLPSKRMGSKAIIKVSDMTLDNEKLNKIALFAPSAKVSRIENYEVAEKRSIEVPESFSGYVKCVNPMCVSNQENIPAKFDVIDKKNITLRCKYCEKITTSDRFEIVK